MTPSAILTTIRDFVAQQGVGQKHLGPTLGPGPKAASREVSRADMKDMLQPGLSYLRKLVLIPIAVTVAVFIVACIVLFSARQSPTVLGAVLATTGITLPLPIWWLTRILKLLWLFEASSAAMPYLSDQQLAKFLATLLETFDASASSAMGRPRAAQNSGSATSRTSTDA